MNAPTIDEPTILEGYPSESELIEGIARDLIWQLLPFDGLDTFEFSMQDTFGLSGLVWILQTDRVVTGPMCKGNPFLTEEYRLHFSQSWLLMLLELATVAVHVWEADAKQELLSAQRVCDEAMTTLLFPNEQSASDVAPLNLMLSCLSDRDKAILAAESAILAHITGVYEQVRESYVNALSLCESPLERAFFIGLTAYRLHPNLSVPDQVNRKWFCCQYQCGRYRLDFALFPNGDSSRKLDIEVDGHTYHERTVEQAVNDRARDREMQLLGWDVLRFHRAEIERDLKACIDSVNAHLAAAH